LDTRNPNTYSSYTRNDLGGRRLNHTESVNRKLIRPSLTEYKEQQQQHHQEQRHHQQAAKVKQKRPVPPDQTNAENFYYVKQMQARTPMVVVLSDGETLHGIIEWYDRSCIKVNRTDAPNLLIYKSNIKYLYKESDKNGAGPEAEAEG
jgi:sRNA-binding regulator protein Hfq